MTSTQSLSSGGPALPPRVAVIAIHGVADQRSGDTARELAALLINTPFPQGRYDDGVADTVTIPAPVPEPMVPVAPVGPGSFSRLKSLRQSIRSDFQRERWTADAQATGEAAPRSAASWHERGDAGLAFTDYLLFKARRNRTEAQAYEMARVRMRRSAAGEHVQQVDVHEMYWADLSRLSGALPRVVTELFTLVFRLSRLGRDTVDQARRSAGRDADSPSLARSWRWLAGLQSGLDWAFSAVLASLFLQLLVMGVLIFVLGLVRPVVSQVHGVLSGLLPITALLAGLYLADGRWRHRVAVIVGAGLLAWILMVMSDAWAIGLTLLGLLNGLCWVGLGMAEERFPGVRPVGLVLMLGVSAALLALLLLSSLSGQLPIGLPHWQDAALHGVEYLLMAMIVWWAVVALMLAGWLLLGWWVVWRAPEPWHAEVRASVATGRLGLWVSLASFLILSMAAWALVTGSIEQQVTEVFAPHIFSGDGDFYANCQLLSSGAPSAAQGHPAYTGCEFLHERFDNSTESFSIVALLMFSLVLYLALVFLPSVLAEVQLPFGSSRALGRWLSAGYRRLESLVGLLTCLGVVAALGVAGLLILARLGLVISGPLNSLVLSASELSRTVLAPLLIATAGATAAFSFISGLLARWVPWLRVPLDVLLDVDNHFREFPRRAIPRARIIARYVGVLEHLLAQGYERIVIVSHSQGTVITAELLRYLAYRARECDPRRDALAALGRKLEGKVSLLTAGCPLRQLYAARFPQLYRWVVATHPQGSGPSAAALGVTRWINTYATGDYVGRWLWCGAEPVPATEAWMQARYDAASGPLPRQPEADVCLGAGAHTHYFDLSQRQVAGCIDELVRH